MRCSKARSRLNDYVDGLLEESEASAVAQHLSECCDCRSEEKALRGILQQAQGLQREMTPPRDLWGAIAKRITGNEERPAPPRSAARAHPIARVAIAVLFFAVVSAGLGLWLANHPSGNANPPSIGYAGCEEALRQCALARASLLADLNARKAQLSSETLATVDENLRIIDTSITDIRNALKGDPEDNRLQRVLVSTYQKETQLLARIVRLADRA